MNIQQSKKASTVKRINSDTCMYLYVYMFICLYSNTLTHINMKAYNNKDMNG